MAPVKSFNVTVRTVVDTVKVAERGDHTPTEAAFLVVARHGEPGLYEFPVIDDNGRETEHEFSIDLRVKGPGMNEDGTGPARLDNDWHDDIR